MIGIKQKTLEMNKLKKYNMTEIEIFEKYDNLSENELNERTECQKWYYEFCHKTLQRRKKRGKRDIDKFRKKLMTPECEISDAQNTTSNQK